MDVTLIENAEHDIHGDERSEDQQRFVLQRRAERSGGALKGSLDARGHPDLLTRSVDCGYGVAQRVARREIKRDSHRGELTLVIDYQRRRSRLEAREGA